MRVPSLFLLVGLAACGRSDIDVPEAPAADAAASVDSRYDGPLGPFDGMRLDLPDRAVASDSHTSADRSMTDSNVGRDAGVDAPHDAPPEADTSHDSPSPMDASHDSSSEADASLDAPGLMDVAEGGDARTDAQDAHAEAKAKDAGRPHVPGDQCDLGDQECAPQSGTCRNDAGALVSCATSIVTCVLGDAGLSVWAEPAPCRADVSCCVLCEYEYDCPLGSVGTDCEQDTDCAWNACNAFTHVCLVNQCGDHRQDGTETDIDCGGFICGPCQRGQGCQGNFDCLGGEFCNASHVCQ